MLESGTSKAQILFYFEKLPASWRHQLSKAQSLLVFSFFFFFFFKLKSWQQRSFAQSVDPPPLGHYNKSFKSHNKTHRS
jgi:hypothetical protein